MPKSDLEVEYICQNKNGCWNFKSLNKWKIPFLTLPKLVFFIIVNCLMLRTVKITS